MLGIIDILTKYKESTQKILVKSSEYIDKLTELYDNLPEFFDVIEERFFDDLDLSKTYFLECASAIGQWFNGKTFTLPSGFVISFEADPWYDQMFEETFYDLKYTVGNFVNQSLISWDNTIQGAYNIAVEPIVDRAGNLICTLTDIFTTIAENFSISDILNRGISLLQCGNMNLNNFCAAVSEYANTATGKVYEVMQAIKDAVSNGTLLQQATNFISVIKRIMGGAIDASASDTDGKITFNDNDYTVDTSICFPWETIVATATGVLSAIAAHVNPILGAVVGLLGAGVSALVNTISENDGTNYKVIDRSDRDNDAFAVPVMQKQVNRVLLPNWIQEHLTDQGMVKLCNALYTMYIWVDSDTETIADVECYVNIMTTDFTYYNNDTDLYYNQLKNAVTNNGTAGTIVNTASTAANNKLNLEYWLDDDVTPGGLAPDVTKFDMLYQHKIVENLITRRVVYSALSLIKQMFDSWGKAGSYTYLPADYLSGPSDNTETEAWKMLISFYADVKSRSWTAQPSDDNLNNVWNFGFSGNVLAAIINYVYPSIKMILNNSGISHLNDIFFLFDEASISDSARYQYGVGTMYGVSYYCGNHCNSAVYPPTTSVSIWARIGVACAAVAAIAVTTALVVNTCKKKLQYKALQKRNEITNLIKPKDADGNEITPTYEQFMQARKETRKYNRFWGKIDGTSFDMRNAWVDYTGDKDLEQASILSSLLQTTDEEQPLTLDVCSSQIKKLLTGE